MQDYPNSYNSSNLHALWSEKETLRESQLPSLSNETGASKPPKEVKINIDERGKAQQVEETVAEIKKSPELKKLKEKAEYIRETNEKNSEPQFEAQKPEDSTSSGETTIAQPAESVVVAPELAPEAKTPAPLDPQFLEHRRQKLSRCFEPFVRVIVEEILAEFPEIIFDLIIEKLAAEIPNTQRAQEFRNRTEIHSKPHSTSSVTRDPQLASAQSSPVPPTVVQPVTQQTNPTPPVTEGSTQVQQVKACLIHVRTDRQIELPQNLSAIHIGKPNNNRPPDVDVSRFPNSEVVSRTHAVIHVEADGFYIKDMTSKNGTYVNNLRLSPGDRRRIETGDYISLGSEDLFKFLFQVF